MKPVQIVWLALIASTVVYACVAVALITVFGVEIGGLPPVVMNVVGPLALGLMGFGLFARRRWLGLIPRDLPAHEREDQQQAVVISSLALIEGGGILMTTMGMIVGAPAWILVGAGAAVLVMVMARP